jgi:hypothetical protein
MTIQPHQIVYAGAALLAALAHIFGPGRRLMFYYGRWIKSMAKGHPGDWRETAPEPVKKAYGEIIENQEVYDPDFETKEALRPIKNPILAFAESVKTGKATVAEAWLFSGQWDEHGKLVTDKRVRESIGDRSPRPYRILHTRGNDIYKQVTEAAASIWESLPGKSSKAREAYRDKLAMVNKLKEAKLIEDSFLFGDDYGGPNQQYDPNQYTEYTPLYGGPFFKQLYIQDYLKMHAYAFEAWNHNPVAKRIVELLSQYSFGRRFKVRIKDKRKAKIWEDFDNKFKIREKCSDFWVREFCIYGELMLDNQTWTSIDPSTVWDIITDPDNIDDKYYYYQSYPTAYQMFTGYRVAGEPGSQNVAASEYIVRQVPANRILHMKGNCVSVEKRGRSTLFPVLGWLKRVKDLYNATVIRQWLLASFIWDDTIDGSAADVQAHVAQYSSMPNPGSVFAHNKAITRQPMPAMESGSGRSAGGGSIGGELLAFIATAVGVPKEFFNVMSQGGGTRANALTSAEPFTKVIEDIQAKFEELLTEIARMVFANAGVDFDDDDIEFLFPSVTKDTTTETLKNLALAESMGWLAKETAAEMAAAELNITNYDFTDQQTKIQDESEQGLNLTGATPMPPGGRFGSTSNGDGSGTSVDDTTSTDDEGESDIHGQGKVDISRSLKKL